MIPMKICLDAGHYGKYNRSPANASYYESVQMWKLHLLLKKYLEEYGVDVVVTRSEQAKDLALEKRGKMAAGCDLFISLHSNAVGSYVDNSTDYPLACLCVNGKADTIGLKLAQCVAGVMGTKQSARTMHRQWGSSDYYGVLRGAAKVGVAGVLLEHSFHTNTTATNWLLSDKNLDKLAKAEADVIARHYGLKKKDATDINVGSTNATNTAFKPYFVKVKCSSLNIRKTPKWAASDVVGAITDKGVYTIVDECMLGSTKFGKLKSGKGWISLGSAYVKKV
jgi:N-acetylmuramoyl-L-alanine amidase